MVYGWMEFYSFSTLVYVTNKDRNNCPSKALMPRVVRKNSSQNCDPFHGSVLHMQWKFKSPSLSNKPLPLSLQLTDALTWDQFLYPLADTQSLLLTERLSKKFPLRRIKRSQMTNKLCIKNIKYLLDIREGTTSIFKNNTENYVGISSRPSNSKRMDRKYLR